MNKRRLNVERLKAVCQMIKEGKRPKDIMEEVGIHSTQYYRYKKEYCEKYKDLLQ